MANWCYVGLVAVGSKVDVDKFLEIVDNTDYTKKHMYFNVDIISEEAYIDEKNDKYMCLIYGEVRSSVAGTLRGGNIENTSKVVYLEDIARDYSLQIEYFSEEPNMGFQEHGIIDNKGNVVKDERIPYYDFYIDEIDTFEQFLDVFTEEELHYVAKDVDEDLNYIKDRFLAAKQTFESTVSFGGFGDWQYEILQM